jgi:hypothetical protein
VAVITSLWLVLVLVRLFPLLFGLNLHRLLLPLLIIVGVVVDPWAKMVSTLLQVLLQKTLVFQTLSLSPSPSLCMYFYVFFFFFVFVSRTPTHRLHNAISHGKRLQLPLAFSVVLRLCVAD